MIIGHELKKIWNLKMLLAVTFICVLYFLAADIGSILRNIRYPVGAQPGTEEYHLAQAPHDIERMLSREFLQWQQQFYMDAIASEDLLAFVLETRNNLYQVKPVVEDEWDIFTQAYGFWGNKFETAGVIITNIEHFGEEAFRPRMRYRLEDLSYWELTERQRARLTTVLEAGEYEGTLHGGVFWAVTDLFRQIAAVLIIASLVLHGPLVTTDRARNILPGQYSSRLGRRIAIKQAGATLLSSVLLATLVLAGFMAVLATHGVFVYWNQGITSHLIHFAPTSIAVGFAPISFGQFMLVMMAICYGFSIGAAAVAYVLSRYSRTLITLAIKAVPVFVALMLFHSFILPNRWAVMTNAGHMTAPLTLWNHMYLRTGIAYLDIGIIAAFVVLGVLVAWCVAHREKRLEAV